MRTLVDDFLDGLRDFATDFVRDAVDQRIHGAPQPKPKAPRARRVGKAPKAKKAKAEKPAKARVEHTHYDTLQIARGADSEIVTAAWKAACRKHHPDTGHGDAKKMAAINSAYEILKDPAKRREVRQVDQGGEMTSEEIKQMQGAAAIDAANVVGKNDATYTNVMRNIYLAEIAYQLCRFNEREETKQRNISAKDRRCGNCGYAYWEREGHICASGVQS